MTPLTTVENWNEDQWQTLFYCEERVVHHGGYLKLVLPTYSSFPDLEAAGLVLLETQGDFARATLTDKGWKWAGFLRQWRCKDPHFEHLTVDHILGTDAEAIRRIGDLLMLSNMSVDTAMYTYGVTTITGDQFREKIHEHCGIVPCSDCGTWVDSGSVNSDDMCEDCEHMHYDDPWLDEYEDEAWEFYPEEEAYF